MLPRCIEESMRWTIEECTFIQRLDEGERDSVLSLSCQPHIDPVLISNNWRPRIHFEGANLSSVAELASVEPRVADFHISRTRNLLRHAHVAARPLPDQIHRELAYRPFAAPKTQPVFHERAR